MLCPFSNIPPAILIGLVAFAYLEQDGVLLTLALIAAVVLLAVIGAAIWELLSTTGMGAGILSSLYCMISTPTNKTG